MKKIPIVIAIGAALVLLVAVLLVFRAESKTNKVSMSESARPVTVLTAKQVRYRASRHYIGTLRPWVEANVGPQFISAYVETVLVRPGAPVKKGEVLATLDCRHASSATRAIAQEARSIEARQKAMTDEAARTRQLLGQGFVSENAVELQQSQSESQQAQLESQKASLAKSALEVDDCTLRAPFTGDVGERFLDPGAFARPGSTIVTVVDRSTIRMVVDVPESDFTYLEPSTPATVHIIPLARDLQAQISRRAPGADPGTRTVHVEVDIPNPRRQPGDRASADREIPVNTTAELRVDIGEPVPAVEVPLFAASVNNDKATLFVVENNTARALALPVLGELGGSLYFDPEKLKPGSLVVGEGRALLASGDRVEAHQAQAEARPTEGAATVIGAADASPKPATPAEPPTRSASKEATP